MQRTVDLLIFAKEGLPISFFEQCFYAQTATMQRKSN